MPPACNPDRSHLLFTKTCRGKMRGWCVYRSSINLLKKIEEAWRVGSVHKILVALLVIILIITACGCLQERNDTSPYSFKIYPPMDVNLSMSGVPSLNQVVGLTLTTTPLTDAPNTTVQILLPDGFVLVSGDLFWNGD